MATAQNNGKPQPHAGMERDARGLFIAKHGAWVGEYSEKNLQNVEQFVTLETSDAQVADAVMVAADYAGMVADMLMESKKPAHSKNVAVYAAARARLAALSATIRACDARPARWGRTMETENYEQAMTRISREASRLLHVIGLNADWVRENGALQPGPDKEIWFPVSERFVTVLNKFSRVMLLWAEGRAWYEAQKAPQEVSDRVYDIVESEAAEAGYSRLGTE